MTRVESKDLAVKKEWVPLEELVGGALERVRPRLDAHRVQNQLPADLQVPVDAILVEQVLLNLLENAARHTPIGTPIELSARREGGCVEVEIADRGPGLPAGEEARLFDKFFRGPSARPGGSGLGLAICRAIVAAHGGFIRAENRPGGGSVFTFALPLPGEPPVVPSEPALGPPMPLKS
jgi:two-component system, OmpR family, sensor histidine kinase KdpD